MSISQVSSMSFDEGSVPHACPGTESDAAGSASACAGCPNQQACKTAPKGPDPGMSCSADASMSTVSSYSLRLHRSPEDPGRSERGEAHHPRLERQGRCREEHILRPFGIFLGYATSSSIILCPYRHVAQTLSILR